MTPITSGIKLFNDFPLCKMLCFTESRTSAVHDDRSRSTVSRKLPDTTMARQPRSWIICISNICFSILCGIILNSQSRRYVLLSNYIFPFFFMVGLGGGGESTQNMMLTHIRSSGAAATAHSEPGLEPVPIFLAARPDVNQLEYLFTLNKYANQSVFYQYNKDVHLHLQSTLTLKGAAKIDEETCQNKKGQERPLSSMLSSSLEVLHFALMLDPEYFPGQKMKFERGLDWVLKGMNPKPQLFPET